MRVAQIGAYLFLWRRIRRILGQSLTYLPRSVVYCEACPTNTSNSLGFLTGFNFFASTSLARHHPSHQSTFLFSKEDSNNLFTIFRWHFGISLTSRFFSDFRTATDNFFVLDTLEIQDRVAASHNIYVIGRNVISVRIRRLRSIQILVSKNIQSNTDRRKLFNPT